jgi:hypothetical protein
MDTFRSSNQEGPTAVSKKVFGAKMMNSFVIRDIPPGRNPTPKPSKDGSWQMPGAKIRNKSSAEVEKTKDVFDPGLTDKYVVREHSSVCPVMSLIFLVSETSFRRR